mmetsp:Transcript_14176/g.38983  ORF Transcript_14176/g.38983 Transcript_14176/m.38983 type:complete len:231 (-) Transcript_14176:413-1105(-)
MPGVRRSSGSWPDMSRSSREPSDCSRSAAMTASFSMGLKVQVLYTSRPPTLSSCAARMAILSCKGWRPLPFPTLHLGQMSGALRMVPSPEQGTSHRMASNWNVLPPLDTISGKFCASWLVTSRPGELARLVWCVRRLHRLRSTSLAMTNPVGIFSFSSPRDPWSISSSWNVLLPGAAHMSSTLWSGVMLRKNAGIMDTVSCRVMEPYSLARLTKSWMDSRKSRRLSCCLL